MGHHDASHRIGADPAAEPAGCDYQAMAHAVDEHVPVAAIRSSVRIMDRFLALAC